MSKIKNMKISFIVNGTETIVTVEKDSKLRDAALKALEQSENTGRELHEWQIIHNDQTWSPDNIVNQFEDQVVFLSLKAGMGGN